MYNLAQFEPVILARSYSSFKAWFYKYRIPPVTATKPYSRRNLGNNTSTGIQTKSRDPKLRGPMRSENIGAYSVSELSIASL